MVEMLRFGEMSMSLLDRQTPHVTWKALYNFDSENHRLYEIDSTVRKDRSYERRLGYSGDTKVYELPVTSTRSFREEISFGST